MAATDASPGFDVHHYLRVLRRRRRLIAVTTFVIVALAVSLSLTQSAMYTANAEIVFSPTQNALGTANTVSFDPARDIQTQIAVLTSAPVRKLAAAALNTATAAPVTASAVVNTNAIQVTASSTDPVLAARVANAYANAYIDYRRTKKVNDLLDAEQMIQGRITDIQHQIDALDAQISSATGANQVTLQANLGPQRTALLAQQGALRQQLDQSQLQSALADTGAQLGSSATAPPSPSSPHPASSAISALILGLFAGIALAFLVDFLDDSVKSPEDAERAAFGLTTLGLTPSVPGWKTRSDAVVVSLTAPGSGAAESYRSLRTAIQFAALDRSLKVIQVTSPGASEGKTTTLANLAVTFGRAGASVCAVDGDLRRPRIHTFFAAPSEPGLTSVANGDVPLSRAIQPATGQNLSLLAAGPPPSDPSELLASARTKGVLTSLANQFDIVLIDSPPVLPVTDAAALARHVDAVVVVVDARRTKKRALTRAIQTLRQVDAPVLGLVVNRAEDETGYGYSYGYSYDNRCAPPVPKPPAKVARPEAPGAVKGRPKSAVKTPKRTQEAPV